MFNSSKMDTSKVDIPNISHNVFSKRIISNTINTEISDKKSGNHTNNIIIDINSTPANSELASLFECPVCFEYVLPPILQCQNGHLVCQSCRQRITSCPTCRIQITTNIRNLQMEKLASTVQFPCKYSTGGCNAHLLYKDKTEHEDTCVFKPYSCPCPGLVLFYFVNLYVYKNLILYLGSSCKWYGPLDQVMPHLMNQHKSITTLEGEDIVFLATDINLSGAVDWVMIQSCYTHHFMLVLEKQEKYHGHQQFFAVVQLIGSEKQAEKFIYRLELNGQRRRLIWEATPRSINEGVQSCINSSDCLVFDTTIAQHFSENGNLGINVTISPV